MNLREKLLVLKQKQFEVEARIKEQAAIENEAVVAAFSFLLAHAPAAFGAAQSDSVLGSLSKKDRSLYVAWLKQYQPSTHLQVPRPANQRPLTETHSGA